MDEPTLPVNVDEKILRKHEIEANKGMIRGCLVTAAILVILLILYLTGVFKTSGKALMNVYIFFPILIAGLVSSYLFGKTKWIDKPWCKYVLISLMLLVMFSLNILLPKHAILGWAICLILANNYFNSRFVLVTYISVAVLMFLGIYLAMFYGEWDANFFNVAKEFTVDGRVVKVNESTAQDRWALLAELRANGDNRYLLVFLYYYVPRLLSLTIISFICFGLASRSFRLLNDEISIATEKEKMKGELEVARAIQASVLPRVFPGDDKERVFALMNPAKEVGGDFYDYFYTDDTHIFFVIADVSGKGVPAALFMMKTETLIKSLATSLRTDTATILEKANNSLCSGNDASMFVTCWIGVLDTVTGDLRYSNAGHNDPVIYHNGKVEFLKGSHGMVLGGMEGMKYRENKIVLNEGDKFILYTDGVTEAHNIHDELFGNDRLIEFTSKHIESDAQNFISSLRKELDVFSEGKDQFDDITMLMVDFHEGANIMESRCFKADTAELDSLFNYSSSLLEILNFSKRDIIMINTALEEVFVNVANYAFKGDGLVEVSLSNDKNNITFVFSDAGKPFNPLERPDPKITADSDLREIGGLGIYMVKNIMDKVEYRYEDGHNILTLTKARIS